MKHISNSLLNEYLDEALALPMRRRVESHLAACLECRGRLEDLNLLTRELAGLPDQPLPHDLVPAVLERLPRRWMPTAVIWRLALAIQAGIAIGAASLFASLVPEWGNPAAFLAVVSRLELPHIALPAFELPAFDLPVPEIHLPSPGLQPTAGQIVFLALSALLLWGIGNLFLLRSTSNAKTYPSRRDRP
jgi:hypothetical protein